MYNIGKPQKHKSSSKGKYHNGTLLSPKEEWNNATCSNMDRPRDYHSDESKSEKDKYHIIPLISRIQKM